MPDQSELRRDVSEKLTDGYEKNRWYRAAQPIFIISKLSNFTSEDKAYIWTLKPASLVH